MSHTQKGKRKQLDQMPISGKDKDGRVPFLCTSTLRFVDDCAWEIKFNHHASWR